MACSVVVLQVTRIRLHLIDVPLDRMSLAFEFDNNDMRARQDDRVGTPSTFAREFILEDETPG